MATISFGQPMNENDMLKATKISSECELMIVMGSSLSVMPAGQIPNLAIQSGAKLVILNREETIYDAMADIVINDEINSSFDLVALESINTEGFIWPYIESLAFYIYSFFMQDEVQ